MTIYNGTITSITYDAQQSLTTNATESSTRVRIRFTVAAGKDSVVLAWGGHIGSRLDWGYISGTDPRSAGGISGSPYHMRQISMNTYPGLVNIPIGNQDRSLAAAAVIPPPECGISAAQTVCPEANSMTYSYTLSTTGKTFLWSINSGNSAGAQISGSATGSSVTIVPIAADFVGGGTFIVTLAVTQNGITSTCQQNGSIYNSPTVTVNSPTKCANDAAVTITATPGSGAGTDYNYVWTVPSGVTNPGNVQSFSASVAGQYCVVITNKTTGCVSAQGCGTLTVNPNPTVTVNSPTKCASDAAVTITATPGSGAATDYNYTWTVPAGVTNPGNVQSFTASVAGQYCVVITNKTTGCASAQGCGTLTVNENPSAPDVTYNPPACDATTFSVTVNGVTAGFTYSIVDKNGNTIAGVNPSSPHLAVAGDVPQFDFTNIPTGSGYQVTVTSDKGCASSPNSCGTASGLISQRSSGIQKQKQDLPKVLAAPNPFNDKIRFSFQSPVSGKGSLELYTLMGQKVATVFQGYVQKGQVQTIIYNIPASQRTNLIYVFRIGNQKVSSMLIGSK